ncbi:glutathione peroxidase-like isoform X1 [Argonauta hians]
MLFYSLFPRLYVITVLCIVAPVVNCEEEEASSDCGGGIFTSWWSSHESSTMSGEGCKKDDNKDFNFYEYKANDIDGNEVSMEKYRGNVCILVNVATK